MFRTIRRTKREISVEEARRVLREGRRAALAVNGDGGYPYAIPVNYLYDEDEGRVYLHGARRGHKVDALRANNKICLTTWDDGEREEGDWACYVRSCVVFGRATLVEDRQLTEQKVRELALKYYPSAEEAEEELRRSLAAVQLIAIDIEHISGKRVHEK